MAFLWWLVSFRSEQLFGRSEQSSQVEAATATRRASFRQFWTLDTIECVIETVFFCGVDRCCRYFWKRKLCPLFDFDSLAIGVIRRRLGARQ